MSATTDRSRLIRLASTLPKGSEERRVILAGLSFGRQGSITMFGLGRPPVRIGGKGDNRDGLTGAPTVIEIDLQGTQIMKGYGIDLFEGQEGKPYRLSVKGDKIILTSK